MFTDALGSAVSIWSKTAVGTSMLLHRSIATHTLGRPRAERHAAAGHETIEHRLDSWSQLDFTLKELTSRMMRRSGVDQRFMHLKPGAAPARH